MDLKQRYRVADVSLEHVRNRAELAVIEALHRLLPEARGFCGCALCVEDVYAAALNRLPPAYRQPGSVVVHGPPTPPEQVEALVREAMERVGRTPNHPA